MWTNKIHEHVAPCDCVVMMKDQTMIAVRASNEEGATDIIWPLLLRAPKRRYALLTRSKENYILYVLSLRIALTNIMSFGCRSLPFHDKFIATSIRCLFFITRQNIQRINKKTLLPPVENYVTFRCPWAFGRKRCPGLERQNYCFVLTPSSPDICNINSWDSPSNLSKLSSATIGVSQMAITALLSLLH